jgi:hypothetical protein
MKCPYCEAELKSQWGDATDKQVFRFHEFECGLILNAVTNKKTGTMMVWETCNCPYEYKPDLWKIR